jgi:hypothetical protein
MPILKRQSIVYCVAVIDRLSVYKGGITGKCFIKRTCGKFKKMLRPSTEKSSVLSYTMGVTEPRDEERIGWKTGLLGAEENGMC